MERKEERRKHVRRPVEAVLESPERIVATSAKAALDFACRGVDISEGGMQILSSVALTVGQRIKLFLHSKGGRALTAEAEVRWVRQERDHYRVGVMFLKKEEAFIVLGRLGAGLLFCFCCQF